jgi:hypothetical protein
MGTTRRENREWRVSTSEAIRGPSRSSIALDPEPTAQADPEPTLNDTCRTPSAMRICGSRGRMMPN